MVMWGSLVKVHKAPSSLSQRVYMPVRYLIIAWERICGSFYPYPISGNFVINWRSEVFNVLFLPYLETRKERMYCFSHFIHCYAFWPEALRVSNRKKKKRKKKGMPMTLGDKRVSLVIGIIWETGCHKCEYQLRRWCIIFLSANKCLNCFPKNENEKARLELHKNQMKMMEFLCYSWMHLSRNFSISWACPEGIMQMTKFTGVSLNKRALKHWHC